MKRQWSRQGVVVVSLVALVVLPIATGLTLHFINPANDSEPELRVVTADSRIEGAPLCPWRDTDADLTAFFGGNASEFRTEVDVRVLSGLRDRIQKQLGRLPSGEENALQIHRVFRGAVPVGNVLVRRVKGGAGAIEIVVATTLERRIVGVRIQRQREPEEVAAVLTNHSWLDRMGERSLESDWTLHGELGFPTESPAAASSAAILDGVRTLLVLLDVAESDRAHRLPPANRDQLHPH